MSNTGVVAAAGMERKTGAKNNAMMKQTAVEKAVRPVRPPNATPDALSTYVVVVLAPMHAPEMVAIASAINALLSPEIRPSGRIMPALVHTPTRVPMVSNISTKRKVHAHACKIGKDTWVYGKDVGHGEECGDACHYLSLDFVLLMVEAKEFF